MDKSQSQLDNELQQLKSRLISEPKTVLQLAEQLVERAKKLFYPSGELAGKILMSRAHWCLMDYRQGLKLIKETKQLQNKLDFDDHLPEILHVHALQFWGQGKYFSALQYWINSLEQAALVDEVEIQIESLIGLGNVWRLTQEYQLAASTHELAVDVANNLRIKWLEGKARILLAWDYYLLHNYTEMLSVLDNASELLHEYPNPTWESEIWDFRGLALLGLGRLDAADFATKKAYNLAIEHDLEWMKAHSYISRARLHLLRGEPRVATELLIKAETSAQKFDNGELLSQICDQQTRVAEENGNFKAAFQAFAKFRRYSLRILREQTNAVGLDKARNSKKQLEQRARKLINRIRAQYEYNPEKQFSNVVSETYWWEQLVLSKTQLRKSNHTIITIRSDSGCHIDTCLELAHSVSTPRDIISRLSNNSIAMLINETGENAREIHQVVETMVSIHPWHRRGISQPAPIVELHDILSFPFTLEQLEGQSAHASKVFINGKFT